MKSVVAALVAVGALYACDVQFNDGRYVAVVMRAVTSLLG